MQADAPTPPQYNIAIVEAVILEVAAELHPQRLTSDELSRRIVSDPSDTREVEIAVQAIRNLGQSGLFHHRDDEIVEPTQAAIRAVALLAG
jgi:hypothetical protein